MDEVKVQIVLNSKDLLDAQNKKAGKLQKAELFGFPDYDNYNSTQEDYIKKDVPVQANKDSLSRFFTFTTISNLPGTKKEVESIKTILENKDIQTTVHLQLNATEEQIKSLSDLSILHIATHGYFLEDGKLEEQHKTSPDLAHFLSDNPLLRAGLLLVGAKQAFNHQDFSVLNEKEDGILTAYEVMNLHLENNELVVLSACETGLGEVINGEGVYGLQRAFIVAGAKSVIMSLWTVSDEATQELMTIFYEEWLKSGNKSEAFAEAQIKLRQKYAHPYYWGAFVLTGNE